MVSGAQTGIFSKTTAQMMLLSGILNQPLGHNPMSSLPKVPQANNPAKNLHGFLSWCG